MFYGEAPCIGLFTFLFPKICKKMFLTTLSSHNSTANAKSWRDEKAEMSG